MKKIFIASHAHFASGIMSTAEFLVGKASNVTVFDAYLDERSVESQVEAFLAAVGPEDQAILLSDIYGGSINQILCRYLASPNTVLVTGANPALVLELLTSQDNLTTEELDTLIDMSRNMMRRMELDKEEAEEEEFF